MRNALCLDPGRLAPYRSGAKDIERRRAAILWIVRGEIGSSNAATRPRGGDARRAVLLAPLLKPAPRKRKACAGFRFVHRQIPEPHFSVDYDIPNLYMRACPKSHVPVGVPRSSKWRGNRDGTRGVTNPVG